MRRLWSPSLRPSRIGALALLAVFGLAAPASAADQVSFEAEFTVRVLSSTKVPGGQTLFQQTVSGKATHLGNFTGTSTRLQDNKGNFIVDVCFVAANGTDSLCFTMSGVLAGEKGSCIETSSGTFTITGGTGSFANATGGGTRMAVVDKCAGVMTITWSGTVSRPNSG